MRKIIKSVAFILAICLFSGLLASCKKNPCDSATFREVAEKKGFKTLDILPQFDSTPQVKEAFITSPKDNTFQIEFYVLDSLDYTKKFYNNLSGIMDEQKKSAASSSSEEGKNYAKCSITVNGMYSFVEYIDNTLIYVPRTDEANKKAIEAFFVSLNY